IWSAGIILYELLAGHLPFQAPSPDGRPSEELKRKIISEPPARLVGIPVDLVAICLRCLEKDPARRYATADDLASDLERFLADEPVEARPLGIGARWLRHAK